MENVFSSLSDDIILNIFHNLQDDPRHWPRLSSVCTRFSSLIHYSCRKNTCSHKIPSDLLSSAGNGGATASFHKLTVCCPGLLHAGVLFNDTYDFGLHRDLGPDQPLTIPPSSNDVASASVSAPDNCYWSLFDDLYYDTVYNPSESEPHDNNSEELENQIRNGVILENEVRNTVVLGNEVRNAVDLEECKRRKVRYDTVYNPSESEESEPHDNNSEELRNEVRNGVVLEECKRSKVLGSWKSHLASGIWNLNREEGRKLLGRQFRDDCLYICDWPGCVHVEEKWKFNVFRGVFKDFKKTRVWRTINDGNRKKVDLGCAFCLCKETWDLHSAFCLRRGFGYHDDGEPVVRAFVCENGHVSGAWTDVTMYT